MRWFRGFSLVILCAVPWLAAGAAFAWTMAGHLPADGRFALDIPIDGRTPWFEAFLPGQRASSPGPQEGGWTGQRITDEPAYARLRLPGAYEAAEIRVEFRPNGQPLAEFGVERGAAGSGAYELHPLWSRELSEGAYRPLETDAGRWWVRPGVTAADLARSSEQRLLWQASGTCPEAWADTGPALPQTVSSSLRGTHDFWFVPVDGRIDFRVWLQDMNRSPHHSTASFRLTRGDELVWTDAVSFGGDGDTKPSVVTDRTFAFKDLAPGAYRLSLLADDTVFVRGWKTTAKHWVVGPRVYFADEVGYSTSTPSVAVWTNSHHFEVKTLHPEGRQAVTLGRASVEVRQTHETYALARAREEAAGPVALRAPRGNVWTLGDGYVSWKPESLFFPNPLRLTDETRLADEGIQAVATPYEAPEPLGDGWYAARFTVPLDQGLDRLKIVIAAPGIRRRGAAFDVRRLRVTYLRPPRAEAWWRPLRQELVRAWRRW